VLTKCGGNMSSSLLKKFTGLIFIMIPLLSGILPVSPT
jgi:hypothetical protein